MYKVRTVDSTEHLGEVRRLPGLVRREHGVALALLPVTQAPPPRHPNYQRVPSQPGHCYAFRGMREQGGEDGGCPDAGGEDETGAGEGFGGVCGGGVEGYVCYFRGLGGAVDGCQGGGVVDLDAGGAAEGEEVVGETEGVAGG